MFVIFSLVLVRLIFVVVNTLKEQDGVGDALSFGTLHGSIQVGGDAWEVLLNCFWIAVLQVFHVIPEHFVILEILTRDSRSQ